MAEIVLGLGTSHGPLLSSPADTWHLRADADRRSDALWYRGARLDYDALAEARGSFADVTTIDVREERHAACQRAIDGLAASWAQARPDLAIIFGNDQREIFRPENTPAIAMVSGDSLEHRAIPPERLATMDRGVALAALESTPVTDCSYPSPAGLNALLFDRAMQNGFDVAAMASLPEGPGGRRGLPHAFGFVFRRIMRDLPVPTTVILFNTFYPPNRPTARRCFDFGRLVGETIRDWAADCRVAVIGSGGLSHFVVDEAFDEQFLEMVRRGDEPALAAIDESVLRGGTSECKNWIGAAGALSRSRLAVSSLTYVPTYRSDAGTGNGQAFAIWQ